MKVFKVEWVVQAIGHWEKQMVQIGQGFPAIPIAGSGAKHFRDEKTQGIFVRMLEAAAMLLNLEAKALQVTVTEVEVE